MIVHSLTLVLTLGFGPPATAGATIKEISADGKQITVEIGTGSSKATERLIVSASTKVFVDNKAAKVADLSVGQKVTVTYDKATKRIESIRRKAPGDSADSDGDKTAPAEPESSKDSPISKAEVIKLLKNEELLNEFLTPYCGIYAKTVKNQNTGLEIPAGRGPTNGAFRLDQIAEPYASESVFHDWFVKTPTVYQEFKGRDPEEHWQEMNQRCREKCGVSLWQLFRFFCESSLRKNGFVTSEAQIKLQKESAQSLFNREGDARWKFVADRLAAPPSKLPLPSLKYQIVEEGAGQQPKAKQSPSKKKT